VQRLGLPHSYLTFSAEAPSTSSSGGKVLRVTFNAEGSDKDVVSILREEADSDQEIFLELDMNEVTDHPFFHVDFVLFT
jgi:hypothetical protein